MGLIGNAGTLTETVEQAIVEAIPDAQVDVQGAGGHFTIRVVSAAFEGKNLLQKRRLVMSAVAPFMKGDDAPVHAIDKLETLTSG
jgi:acid stress-induced BolA-like protein IbaG/YrbA